MKNSEEHMPHSKVLTSKDFIRFSDWRWESSFRVLYTSVVMILVRTMLRAKELNL